jgi:zinc protease
LQVTLPNGLTAVLVESHAAPVVALQVWVKVGGADERPEEAGLAHLHEHMLFKGTRRRATGEIAREVEARGGEINAWTSHDQTVYHLVLAAPFLRDGLDILADAVRDSSFDADELRRETQVIVEEIKRSDDSPSRQLSKALFATAYRVHPYRLPVIGTPASVLSFQRAQILSFYRRHYAPSQMVVVAVGDFAEERALAEIERLFGDWQAGDRHAPAEPGRPAEPAQREPRVRVDRGDVRETRFALAFHIPELLHPDLPALDVLAVLLGQGESARLPQLLRRGSQVFNEVHAYAYAPRDAGLWVAGGTPVRGREKLAVEQLLAELGRARTELFSELELEKAKHLLESEQVYARETVQGMARKLGFYQTAAGSLEAEAEYQAALQSTSLADVQAVARRYLKSASASLVALVPQAAEPLAAELSGEPLAEGELLAQLTAALPNLEADQRRAQSMPGPRPVAELHPGVRSALESGPRLVRQRLSSGGMLLVKPDPVVPLVAVRAAFLGGLRLESEANNGITALLARTVTHGAGGRTADQIAATIDGIAGSLAGVPGRNSFGFRAEFLARHLEEGIALLADVMLAPDFPRSEVDRERSQQLQEIHSREDHPVGLAFELFAKTLFTVHPNRLPVGGEAASVSKLDGEVLRRHRAAHYPPEALTLVVVGAVRPDEVHALLEAAFRKTLAKVETSSRAEAVAVAPEPRRVAPRSVHRELAKAQSHLVVGFLGASFQDPARYPLDVLASVLSGQGGRLFFELRDKQSLAYSVSAMSVDGLDPGYFAVYLGTSPEKAATALEGIRVQLARVRQERVSEAELERAKRYLVGSHAIGLQRRSSLAATLALDELYGLGAEAYLDYDAKVHAVTADAILDAAQKFLDPRGEVVAEVGPGPGKEG